MRQNIRKAICDEKQYKDGIARYGGDWVKKKILLVISTLSGGGAERVFAVMDATPEGCLIYCEEKYRNDFLNHYTWQHYYKYFAK